MTERILQFATMRIGRRKVLKGALATTFATIAGAAVGRKHVEANDCVGPGGSGYCGATRCSGSACTSDGYWDCTYVTGFCYTGTSCWTGSTGTCCDCFCAHQDSFFYCDCG